MSFREHNEGNCWPSTCDLCAYEDSLEWTCEVHDVATMTDCPECDDELIALTEAGQP